MHHHNHDAHSPAAASAWVQRWSHLAAPGARVLDIACGSGRHLLWFAQRGCQVTGLDIDTRQARALLPDARLLEADIENGPWPLRDAASLALDTFDVVVVTNYLWRPLMPTVLASLARGGVLIYETFATGNETVGRPARLDFLLQPGELLSACKDMHIVAYENGFLDAPERFVQRIVAVNDAGSGALNAPVPRYAL